MNIKDSKVSIFLAFAIGGASGALAACQYFKAKYKKIANDEIASVKEVLSKKRAGLYNGKLVGKKRCSVPHDEKMARTDYAKILGYDTAAKDLNPSEKPVLSVYEPYVIAPEDFGNQEGYEEITLFYYKDKKIADERDSLLTPEEIRTVIGSDAVNHFGEFEEDSVFIRNDLRKCDYEILLDMRTFADAVKMPPDTQEE